MRKTYIIPFILMAASPLLSQATLGGIATWGTPVISGVTASPDANTIVLNWTTNVPSDTSASCGALSSLHDAAQDNVTTHSIPVPQLTPSTPYTCQVCSHSICQDISSTTTAAPASMPITGVTMGSVTNYNLVGPHSMIGDGFWNIRGTNGTTYATTGDSGGWNGSTTCQWAAIFAQYNTLMSNVSNVNLFSAWPGCTFFPSTTYEYPHPTGLFSIAGKIISSFSQQQSCASGAACAWSGGAMAWTPDFGATWNSFSAPTVFNANPSVNSPFNLLMLPNGPPYFDTMEFVLYANDDGTLGYSTAGNRVQNANAYVYILTNASSASAGHSIAAAGDSLYLARVPRAQVLDLNAADYQFYIGGDGTQASAWSNTQSAATAILTNDCNAANLPTFPGCLAGDGISYIPALNRYLMPVWYWDNGAQNPANTHFLFYEAPAPWGPWTLIQTMTFTNGSYGPVFMHTDVNSAGLSPTQFRMSWSENWQTGNQNLFFATMTVTH